MALACKGSRGPECAAMPLHTHPPAKRPCRPSLAHSETQPCHVFGFAFTTTIISTIHCFVERPLRVLATAPPHPAHRPPTLRTRTSQKPALQPVRTAFTAGPHLSQAARGVSRLDRPASVPPPAAASAASTSIRPVARCPRPCQRSPHGLLRRRGQPKALVRGSSCTARGF